MKKFLSIFLGIAFAFASCQSKDTKDGLFAKIETNKGTMEIELYYKLTPVTVANFVSLAEGTNTLVSDPSIKGKKYYNGTVFHRVIKDFMIQGGDRTATGSGTPGYEFDDEFVDSLVFDKKGILAMANAGPSTNGSQFFITQVPTTWLNHKHTIFGRVIKGENVIDTIANSQTNPANDKPVSDVVINDIKIIRVGKDAKGFDAPKVFNSFMKKQSEIKLKKEEEAKKKAEAFIKDAEAQKLQAKALPSGLKLYYLKEIKDGVKPKDGERIGIFYAGYLSNGILFDTNIKDVAMANQSYNQDRDLQGGYQPMPAVFTKDMPFVPGFKEAMLNMKKGEKLRAFIPSSLGYGSRGAGGVIPPNSDLIFDIEIQ